MRDPDQYARFSDERSRPYFDLLRRVPRRPFREIVDLGCGTGELTRALSETWPEARVVGLDASPQMLAKAAAFARPGVLEFVEGDILQYDRPADLVYSNASLHWVDDHATLFPRLAELVRPGGVFATQMPSNFDQPSHLLMERTAESGPWAAKLASWKQLRVEPLRFYVNLLLDRGFTVDAWETVYYFLLQGEDPILEWVKGTSLQPILNILDEDERAAFSSAYAAALRAAYPATDAGTLFPFKRIFFVASRDG